jgi:hypothetical protein
MVVKLLYHQIKTFFLYIYFIFFNMFFKIKQVYNND